MVQLIYLLLGTLFGFALSRAGATTYDYYAGLFLFQDLQLMEVIGTAVAVGVVGFALVRRFKPRSLLQKEPIHITPKPYKKTLIPGSLIFGLGWGLAGACPGTALVMLGEGKLGVLFTLAGLILGTYSYGVWESRKLLRVDVPEFSTEARDTNKEKVAV